MDLSKLSPAPWASQWQMGGEYKGHNLLGVDTLIGRIYKLDDAEFIVLARAALDVMLRRGWGAIQYWDKSWGVQNHKGTFPKGLGGQAWPYPFTALVEADRWFKENVEKTP